MNNSTNGTNTSLTKAQYDVATAFFIVEAITTGWFTLDYFVRFFASTNKLRFLKKPFNIIDLISNSPFYVELIFSSFSNDIKNTLRVFQTLRIIRLARHSDGIKALGNTLKESRKDLLLMIMVYGISAFIISSLVYLVEKDEPDTKFESIPIAFYWGMITMTTVYLFQFFFSIF